jgi:hypothetical protein
MINQRIENDNAMFISLSSPISFASVYIFVEEHANELQDVFDTSSSFPLSLLLSAFYRHSLLRDDINLPHIHSLVNILERKIIILPFILYSLFCLASSSSIEFLYFNVATAATTDVERVKNMWENNSSLLSHICVIFYIHPCSISTREYCVTIFINNFID